jgi:hypothetical protein
MSRRSLATSSPALATKTQPARSPPISAIQQRSRAPSKFLTKAAAISAASASKRSSQPNSCA